MTKGRQRIKDFSWEKCAEQTLQVIIEAAKMIKIISESFQIFQAII